MAVTMWALRCGSAEQCISAELREEQGFLGRRRGGFAPERLAHFMERKAGQAWA